MRAKGLTFCCPVCGSASVFYSCTPNCCFNHVCADCGATFEPVTSLVGGSLSGVLPPDPLPDAADPTAECARCQSTQVYATDDGRFVCTNCGMLLKLEFTEITPAS